MTIVKQHFHTSNNTRTPQNESKKQALRIMENKDTHWESVYKTKSANSVSWYTPHLRTSIRLIQKVNLDKNKAVIDIGGGASTFLDDLLELGYNNLSVLDISSTAIGILKKRLKEKGSEINWHVGDITTHDFPKKEFDLWHDRAVFHFLTDKESRLKYIRLLKKSLKKNGTFIIGSFGPEGPLKCSGLEIKRYSALEMLEELGNNFELISSEINNHETPFETNQQFLYCRFKFL